MKGKNLTLPLFGDTMRRTVAALAAWFLFTGTDLFCGASGVGTGFINARVEERPIMHLVQGVNHDPLAIASSKANYATVNYMTEDITTLDAGSLARTAILWASLECTNFSNAKGGQSRDADSRSLAEHMERYILAIRPMYFLVENVREFLSWGPLYHKHDKQGNPLFRRAKVMASKLDKHLKAVINKRTGKPQEFQVRDERGQKLWKLEPVMLPVSRTKGRDFLRWKQSIEDLGYTCHQRLLNAADFGERTSRVRLFLIFAKKGLPVAWPQATHSKGGKTLGTEPWLPVRPCLQLEVKGTSIFGREKPLVEKTLKRIYAGLCKYIAGQKVEVVTKWLAELAASNVGGSLAPAAAAQPEWLTKRTSNPPSGRANPGASLDEPAPTVATCFHPDLVQAEFLTNPGWQGGNTSADAPAHTIVARQDKVPMQLVQPEFLTQYNGNITETRIHSLDEPCNTLSTENRFGLVQPEFLQKYYGNGDNVTGTDQPAGTLTTKDRMGLVQPEFIQRHYSNGENVASLDEPVGALTTRDKMSLIQTEFLDKRYGSGDHNHQSIDAPAGSITTNDHHALVQAEPWLINTNFNNEGSPLDAPAPTLTAGRHHPYLAQPEPWLLDNKFNNVGRDLAQPGPTLLTGDHHYLVSTETAWAEPSHWQPQPDDSETMLLIRQFMRAFGLADVLLRMLLVDELLKIQGFPDGYVLLGSDTDKKKFIGNSVPPKLPQRITEALYHSLWDNGLLHLLGDYQGGTLALKKQRSSKRREALAA